MSPHWSVFGIGVGAVRRTALAIGVVLVLSDMVVRRGAPPSSWGDVAVYGVAALCAWAFVLVGTRRTEVRVDLGLLAVEVRLKVGLLALSVVAALAVAWFHDETPLRGAIRLEAGLITGAWVSFLLDRAAAVRRAPVATGP